MCAFPYILAFTSDSIEIRLLVNGSLVHTAIMPELQLITAKKDIFFITTAPEIFTKQLSPKELRNSEICFSRKSSQGDSNETMNQEIDINPQLTLPGAKNEAGPYIKRARSLQKSNCSSEEKKCISKSNSYGDHVRNVDFPETNLDIPSNTTRPAISPCRRPSNTRYRLLFQPDPANSSNDSIEKTKPLRVYRIPLVNLAGNQSHFHTHTSKIKPILKLVNSKIEENNLENKSNNDVTIDNKQTNDVTKKLPIVVEKNPIDKITCNCANLSLFTS